jgi:hydroxymethylglutaryl-CoA lyase
MQQIILHEVGLRDGLQMEAQTVPIERKLAWIRAIAEAGVEIIQVGSFVHPTKVPQMADTPGTHPPASPSPVSS